MQKNIRIDRFSETAIWQEANKRLIDTLKQNLDSGKKTLLLLSGGSCINLYTYLSDYLCHPEFISGSILSIAQVDERFQPESQKDINARAIKKVGFQVPYYIVSQEGSVEKSAEEYNRTIEDLWKKCDCKIAVLGIGEDCHTAGLIPGYEKDWNIDRYIAGYDLQQGKFRKRITITPKLMEKLDYALIVAAGLKKKEAIKNALKKENLENLNKYPAAIIQKIPKTDLFLTFDL